MITSFFLWINHTMVNKIQTFKVVYQIISAAIALSLDNIKVLINEIIENSRLSHGYWYYKVDKDLYPYLSGYQKE